MICNNNVNNTCDSAAVGVNQLNLSENNENVNLLSKINIKALNKSEMSMQTDTPINNSIWNKYFGFLGAFKCG